MATARSFPHPKRKLLFQIQGLSCYVPLPANLCFRGGSLNTISPPPPQPPPPPTPNISYSAHVPLEVRINMYETGIFQSTSKFVTILSWCCESPLLRGPLPPGYTDTPSMTQVTRRRCLGVGRWDSTHLRPGRKLGPLFLQGKALDGICWIHSWYLMLN